ncbi:MAG: hypothetical protein ACXVCP_17175 [Bdellovibrio sp.]
MDIRGASVELKRIADARNKIGHKRVQRVMQMNGMSLAQAMPEQKKSHTGIVMTLFFKMFADPQVESEIRCFNGEKVYVGFVLGCCVTEAFIYVARARFSRRH